MTRRDLAKLERQAQRAREDRKRLSEFAEAGPSFTTKSDGSGRERNPRLRALDDLNRHGSLPCDETFNEARARLLPVNTARLAREASGEPEPLPPLEEWWMNGVLAVVIGLSAVVLGWAAVEWWLMVKGGTP